MPKVLKPCSKSTYVDFFILHAKVAFTAMGLKTPVPYTNPKRFIQMSCQDLPPQHSDLSSLISLFPQAQCATNPGTTPVPRNDWLREVQANHSRARITAESINIIFDGDSITNNWVIGGAKIWEQHIQPMGVFNFAMNGDQTQHLLWRLQQGQLEGLNPKLVVLLVGTNNLGHGQSPEQTVEGIKAVVTRYREQCPAATLLLQAIFPCKPEASDPRRDEIRRTNEQLKSLTSDKKLVFVDFGTHFLEADGRLNSKIMYDHLHLTPYGYQLWADALLPTIQSILASNN